MATRKNLLKIASDALIRFVEPTRYRIHLDYSYQGLKGQIHTAKNFQDYELDPDDWSYDKEKSEYLISQSFFQDMLNNQLIQLDYKHNCQVKTNLVFGGFLFD